MNRSSRRRTRSVRAAFLVPVILVALVAWSGCATITPPPSIPALAVQPGEVYEPGKMVCHDYFSKDADQVVAFYSGLFGWEIRPADEYGNFKLFTLNGKAIGGLIKLDGEEAKSVAPQWVPSLLVADVDQAVERFLKGGKLDRKPVDVPDRGRIALVEDSEGAPLMLLQTSNGVPAGPDGSQGSFLWTELWSLDEAKSLAFYQAAVGYKPLDRPMPGGSENTMLGVGSDPQVGLVQIQSDAVKPHWLSYIAVDDPMAIAERTIALGGRVLIAPSETMGRSAAVLADPLGGIFGVQQWPLNTETEAQP